MFRLLIQYIVTVMLRLFRAVPGFQDAIRNYVLHSLSITFQRVSLRVLGDWLKLDGSALQQLLADKVCMDLFHCI